MYPIAAFLLFGTSELMAHGFAYLFSSLDRGVLFFFLRLVCFSLGLRRLHFLRNFFPEDLKLSHENCAYKPT